MCDAQKRDFIVSLRQLFFPCMAVILMPVNVTWFHCSERVVLFRSTHWCSLCEGLTDVTADCASSVSALAIPGEARLRQALARGGHGAL